MQVIHEANDKITKLWDEGKIVPTATYRLLSYVVAAETEGGMLLHNAVTGELVFLGSEEADLISSLPCAYSPWMDELITKHFLTQEGLEDMRTVDSLRLVLKLSEASKDITSYTILPTTRCNARCFYCYEAGCEQQSMNDETADKLVDFMDDHRGGKPLHLSWFGGEPLLGIRQINRICQTLRGKGIPFTSSMASNGYLFDAEIAARAGSDWNLEQIQITLDGTEAVYNQAKAYLNPCESPYQRVLENIGYLLEHSIHVDIRLNLGLHNADDLNGLVSELAERFEDKAYLGVYTNLLFDGCGFEPTHFSTEEMTKLVARKKALDDRIRSYAPFPGKGKLPKLRANHCMADNTTSAVVLPSGRLGKCEHYSDSHYVGSLEEGIVNKQELQALAEREIFPECASCPLYPACIKLKLCEPEHHCNNAEVQSWLRKITCSMQLYYEAFLRGEDDFETSDEDPRC